MLDLTFCPDGRVLVPSGGDPAAAHWPTGWSRAFLGMDLGRNDPSAFVLIKDQCVPMRSANGGRILLAPRERTVVWADRVRDTSYTDLAAYVGQLLARDQLRNTTLTIDATGLGGPFSDTLIQGGIEHFALTMTAGAQMNRKGYRVTCSKNVLLETLASGFETGELAIAADLPLRNQLIQEIAAFELATTAAGNLVLEGGGKGHHSDMAIACALAYLTSEKLSGKAITTRKLLNYY